MPLTLPLVPSLALAMLGGLVLPLAFAPFSWWPLAILSLLLLYALLQACEPRRALWIGATYGLAYFGIGVSWVYHSIHLFGAAIAPLAAGITILFVMVMAVFPALVAWLWAHLRRPGDRLSNAVLFAALWSLGELLRGKIMGGFPWILIGYSQTSAPLGELAPVLGVYAIGFLVVLGATLLYVLMVGQTRRRLVAALIIVLLPASAAIVSRLTFSEPVGEPLGVRLVQANVPQALKFSDGRLRTSLLRYTDMTRQPGLEKIDLVIWPETAIPTWFARVDEWLEPFVHDLDGRGIDVLSGGFHREEGRSYNSVRQLGGERALYRKRHLVPFGEYMPMRFLLDHLARYIEIPMSDLSAGDGPHVPLMIQQRAIGVSICYEDVYGEEMRALLPASTLLVNVSNDAWFGDSFAPHQHEEKARMRAREFARPLIRVTNTGISSAIDERGRVSGRIDHDTAGILDVSVLPREGMTPYARTGNWPIAVLAVFIVIVCLLRRRPRRTSTP